MGYVPYQAEKGARHKLRITFARCSERDVWDKTKAHLICTGRLRVGKFTEINRPKKGQLYRTLIREIKANDQRVKKAYEKQSQN